MMKGSSIRSCWSLAAALCFLLVPHLGLAGPGWSPALAPVLISGSPPLHGIEEPDDKNLANHASRVLYHTFQKSLATLVHWAEQSECMSAELKSGFMDKHNRCFFLVSGKIQLKPERVGHRTHSVFEKLHGYWLTTNGPIAIDLSFPGRIEDENGVLVGLEFELDLVVIAPQVVDMLTRSAINAGLSGAGFFLGRYLIPFLQNLEINIVGKALARTVDDAVLLGAGDVGQEVLSRLGDGDLASRKRRASRLARLIATGLTAGALLNYFWEVILNTAATLGLRAIEGTIGAILGSFLFPGGGAIIGGILGAVALPLLGDVVISTITIDIPLWWRLKKLLKYRRKAAREGTMDTDLDEAIAAVETKLLDRVKECVETDSYAFFDALVAKLGKMDPEEKAVLREFLASVKDHLMWAVLQEENWNAARKYYQLLHALGESATGQPAGMPAEDSLE